MDERLSQLGFEPYELPADHRQRLDEDGYTVFEGVIGEGWLAALREAFDHVFESEGDEAGKEVGLVEGVRRLADLVNMSNDGEGNVRLEYTIPTRGLIGFRSAFLRDTRGTGVTNSVFTGFQPMSGEVKTTNNGVLVASETGTALTYGLINAQGRGETFVEPGTAVYEGMIVGVHPKDQDITINVCKEKKLTNMRSATADIVKRLSPPVRLSLEDALDFIADDELVEVTPQNFRLRKKLISDTARNRHRKNVAKGRV